MIKYCKFEAPVADSVADDKIAGRVTVLREVGGVGGVDQPISVGRKRTRVLEKKNAKMGIGWPPPFFDTMMKL